MEEDGATEFDLDWEDVPSLGSFTTIWHDNKVKSICGFFLFFFELIFTIFN
jgi:hypothetical protein